MRRFRAHEVAAVALAATACGGNTTVEVTSTGTGTTSAAGGGTSTETMGGGGTTSASAGGVGGTRSSASTGGSGGGAFPCMTSTDCVALNDACNKAICEGGFCAKHAVNDGMTCDDGDGCTVSDSCFAGECTGILADCNNGDGCCPMGCTSELDNDCLYWKPGVQGAVNVGDLTQWFPCYNGTYNDKPSIEFILSSCTKAKILMACRSKGSLSFNLVAMGPREDVLFDCGQQTDCTKQSNSVGWYFSEDWSWGFAPGGEPVNRTPCDYSPNEPSAFRMCWRTAGGALDQGARCGQLIGDPFVSNWERYIFHAD
jgi:hypothetical protein